MATYRALIPGGFYSSTPQDKSSGPVSIRMNNPGAINGASWEKTFPGYVGETETTPGNRSTTFEAPEYGVAAWWTLLKKYRASGYTTLRGIIVHYGGGGQTATYEEYARTVAKRTGLSLNQEIKLDDDATLLKFARGMFQEEAGKPSPLSDAQILYGFQIARQFDATGKVPADNGRTPATQQLPAPKGFWAMLGELLSALTSKKRTGTLLVFKGLTKIGDKDDEEKGGPVWQLQTRLTELGASDLNIDGDFGEVTEKAVRTFQSAHRLDPSGIVDQITVEELNKATPNQVKPPLNPPSTFKYGDPPSWYKLAEKDIGFHEKGVNLGIEKYIDGAKSGTRAQLLGEPWCATAANYWLETSGVPGSRSAMARSYETSSNFVKLSGPALGAIVTNWRVTKEGGQGHVFFYDGENERGVRGIGANENDQVQRSFHDRSHVVGYYWPRGIPLPDRIGPIIVNDAGQVVEKVT
jgi:uncharacterized protein (TIGR02594 family)